MVMVTTTVRVTMTRRSTAAPGPGSRKPGAVVPAGPSGGGVPLPGEPAPAVAEVHATEPTACVTLSPSAAARLDECTETFLVTVLIFLLRRAGWHHIHAATALDPAGRGWLLAGDGLAGESTTAAPLPTPGPAGGTHDTAFPSSLH